MAVKSPFEGIFVLAKFFLSPAPDGTMNCISRSLGKLGVIDRKFKDKVQNGQIWVCKILKEIHPGRPNGNFIFEPIEHVEDVSRILKIIPGFYKIQTVGKGVLVMPDTDFDKYWMLAVATRQIFSKKYYAVVVPIAYKGHLKNISDAVYLNDLDYVEKNNPAALESNEISPDEIEGEEKKVGAS